MIFLDFSEDCVHVLFFSKAFVQSVWLAHRRKLQTCQLFVSPCSGVSRRVPVALAGAGFALSGVKALWCTSGLVQKLTGVRGVWCKSE